MMNLEAGERGGFTRVVWAFALAGLFLGASPLRHGGLFAANDGGGDDDDDDDDHHSHPACNSKDGVNSPGCWKHRSDAELAPLLSGPLFSFPVVCGLTVDTPAKARAILSTGGSKPCDRFKRDALTTILNVRRSTLSGDGLLGGDGASCLGVSDFSIVLRCGSFFIPDPATPDPDDAITVDEHTPVSLLVQYGSQLCEMASCPPTNNSTCGKTIGAIASALNAFNASTVRHSECGGVCSSDKTPPVITCPTGILDFECTGPDGAAITYTVTATDNCDPTPTVSCYPPPGTVLPTGTMRTVDCTAKDKNGNTATCWFKVRVVDTRPPVISCPPGPIVVDCVPGGGNGAVVHYPDATATDVCDSTPTIVCNPPSGSFFPFGVTTVQCTATDDSGNMSMCTFDVEVVEAAAPTLHCPGDITAECTGPDGAAVSYPPPVVSSTCNPPPAPSCMPPSGSVFPIGSTTVTCSTTDSGGNLLECRFSVTVVDTRPPVITCPQDALLECSSAGGAPLDFTVSATDTCDPSPTVACVPPSGSFFPVGETTVHCTATDHSGNSSGCSFRVIVRDSTPPEISCPQGPVLADCTIFDPGPGAIVNYPPPVASDACDPDADVTCVPPSGSVFPLGRTTVTCTATDSEGNSAQCSFDVLVVDQTPPMLVCPGDFFAECTSPDGAAVSYPAPVVADECDRAPLVSCTPPSGSLFPMGTTAVTCRAVDASGNAIECQFRITVADNTPPRLACPADKIVECVSPYGTRVEYTATATDDCDPAPAVTCTPPSGSFFPLGLTEVRCTAVDASGNESTCTFRVAVVDTLPPSVRCPAPIVVECESPEGSPVTFAGSAGDECAGAVEVVCSPPSGSLFPMGRTTVVCTATDPSGNTSQCEFEVTVVDTRPPRITCSQDAVVLECTDHLTAEAQYPDPVVSDLCDPAPSVACDPPAGTTLGLGSHTVTCTATDDSGNSASCSFEVRVVDTQPPTILNCPSNITAECTGPNGAVVTYDTPTASDTCDPAPNLVCLPASGSLFPIGETTVTCTADDQSDNMIQCTFQVKVVDTMPPAIQCPSDIVVPCTSSQGATVSYTVTATDTCDPSPTVTCTPASGSVFPLGMTTVSCVARDLAGNESRCSFLVTVRDDAPPRITCPESFETDCVDSGGAVVTYPAPQVSDDCDPAPTVVCDPPSGTKLGPGPHAIHCTATDASGNSSSCELTVTVVDRTAPMLVCPAETTVECTGPGGAVVSYPLPVATDACDAQPSVNCVPPSGGLFPMGSSEVVCTARDRDGNSMQCTFLVTVRDTTPPDIRCPAPVTASCTSPDGADVTFEVTATDACDAAPSLACDPPSGSHFPMGATTVRCTAEDAAGNRSECSFTVTVVDRTPPEITCPPDIVVQGTTSGQPPHKPAGWPPGSHPQPNEVTASVFYDTPTAADSCQTEAPQVTCDPPPGTRLGFGMHTITCRARDRAGNEATCTFKVTVVLGEEAFIRGDANGDKNLDIGDPVWIVNYLFLGLMPPRCMDAADTNDDGTVNIADVLYDLNYSFRGGPPPPAPFLQLCGLDPTPDGLDCRKFLPCE